MSFNAETVKPGRGRCIGVDVSTDGFATFATRWGDVADFYQGNRSVEGSVGRSARIVSLGPIRRGLGQSHVAAGGSCELVLDNADGGCDWLCGRDNMAVMGSARFRVWLFIYDPASVPLVNADFESKLLGEFTLAEWPRRNNSTVSLQLQDDMMGPLAQQASLPTLRDWQGMAGSTSDNNPFHNTIGFPDSISPDAPIQLAFGEDWIRCLPHLIPWGSTSVNYIDRVIVPICCTTNLITFGTASQDLISNVRVRWFGLSEDGDTTNQGETGLRLREVPRTSIKGQLAVSTNGWPTTYQTNWYVQTSPTITKNGRDFQILYLVVQADMGLWMWEGLNMEEYAGLGNYPAGAVQWASPATRSIAMRCLEWYVKGFPLSARTQTTSPVQHAVDVITDLATHYCDNANITVDTDSAARIKAGNPDAACTGVIQPWTVFANNPAAYQNPPSLRQAITQICQSSDIDVFMSWGGELSFSSDVRDFITATQAATLTNFTETQLEDMEEWIPNPGERWAVCNRVYMKGGRGYPAEDLPIPFQGPFDFDTGSTGVDISDRIIEASLEQGWRPWRQQALQPLQWRCVDIYARSKIRFRTGINAMILELGAYFTLTWTRGGAGTVFNSTTFQVDAISYASGDDSVEVEAIWRDDIVTENAYLLDDEDIPVRSKGGLTGNAIPTDADIVCNFGGTINLTTMGVVVGDVLVLRCTTDPEDDFNGNGAFLITTIVGPTEVNVTPAFGTFVTNPIPNAEWYIIRGATTYPTAVSDPTNYPDGSEMYGKTSDTAGEFSDSTTGNKLISG